MKKGNTNAKFHKAKKNKNDEFYTRLETIEKELQYYWPHFENKVVFANCDDPTWSNFYKYFRAKFKTLKLKEFITTHYEPDPENLGKTSYLLRVFLDKKGEVSVEKKPLKGNGDFRSEECIDLLKRADIVVTNPPFSLWREYVAQLMEYKKKFLILGSVNCISYKDIFPLIKEEKMWLGTGIVRWFLTNIKNLENMVESPTYWYTNLDYEWRYREKILLVEKYTPEKYPKYDNYDAINVDRTKDIPKDYYGEMGVPITFLDKHNPKQFEIIRFRKGNDGKDLKVNGKDKYTRLIIKRRK